VQTSSEARNAPGFDDHLSNWTPEAARRAVLRAFDGGEIEGRYGDTADMAADEIGDALGIPGRTVRTILHEAGRVAVKQEPPRGTVKPSRATILRGPGMPVAPPAARRYASVAEALAAQDRFLCPRYKCSLTATACLARQDRPEEVERPAGGFSFACPTCPTGAKVRETVAALNVAQALGVAA